MLTFEEHQRHYREQHTTKGCKITHMFGVPMIVCSLPLFFVDWRVASVLFVFGWTLQFVGHFVFEKNKPMLMNDPGNPLTYFSAVIFVSEEWLNVLTFKAMRRPQLKPVITTESEADSPSIAGQS